MNERSEKNPGWAARVWWTDLQPNPENAKAPRGNPKALAMLRRAHSWVEAAAVPETITLFRKLGMKHENELPRVAVLAAVLAQVKKEAERDKQTGKFPVVAASIGKAPNDSETRAVLSELRLGRLLSMSGDDDILIAFRRLVALMGKTANVADLAEQILYWDHPTGATAAAWASPSTIGRLATPRHSFSKQPNKPQPISRTGIAHDPFHSTARAHRLRAVQPQPRRHGAA